MMVNEWNFKVKNVKKKKKRVYFYLLNLEILVISNTFTYLISRVFEIKT